jgi:hypothetical protein
VTTLLLAGFLALLGLAHGRRFVDRVELTLIGCNDDFNSRASNLAALLERDPDIIFIQEGKAADYRGLLDPRPGRTARKLLPRNLWRVHQDTSTAARAGAVVIYRHDVVLGTGAGFTFGVKALGLLARWIAWVRGTISGRRVFLFSAHPPPFRARRWWHPFDVALWARLRTALAARRLVIGQMDSNRHGGQRGLPKRLRWVAVGKSIDGFVLSRSIEILDGPTELPKGSSDHHPITLRVRIPVTGRKPR